MTSCSYYVLSTHKGSTLHNDIIVNIYFWYVIPVHYNFAVNDVYCDLVRNVFLLSISMNLLSGYFLWINQIDTHTYVIND